MNDPLRFAGEGVTFRAKLIGVLEVNAPRGDRLCQEALGELKMAIKAAGEHKQRIMICIALDGLRLRDERTGVWKLLLEQLLHSCMNNLKPSRTAYITTLFTKYRLLRKTWRILVLSGTFSVPQIKDIGISE